MKVQEFTTSSPAVKFTVVGDKVAGTIVDEPELQPDKYGNPGDKVLVLSILDNQGVTRRLFARKQMLGAIGDAVTDAGSDEISNGGWLAVTYLEDKPTGAGSSPMKVYAAKYTPSSPVGHGVLGAEDDDSPTW
jgi:hypothetical protein